jgi:hypothetical protein
LALPAVLVFALAVAAGFFLDALFFVAAISCLLDGRRGDNASRVTDNQ